MSEYLADPRSPETFESCRLNWTEFDRNGEAVALHRDLLKLRRDHPAFTQQQPRALDGSVLGPEAFVLRFFGDSGDDRLLLVNLGLDLDLRSIPDPLAAPPEGSLWDILWSSEHPSYGGSGTPPIETESGWHLPGHAAVVMAAQRAEKGDDAGT
jgi:maltooligosyltrehalose trehalohydrolase